MAASLSGLDISQPIDIGGIPVNPHLFGDEPEGRRFAAVTEVQFEGDERFYRLDVDLEDLETLEEMSSAARDYIDDIIGRYPGAFKGRAAGEYELANLRTIFIERRF